MRRLAAHARSYCARRESRVSVSARTQLRSSAPGVAAAACWLRSAPRTASQTERIADPRPPARPSSGRLGRPADLISAPDGRQYGRVTTFASALGDDSADAYLDRI